jgi:hypothetical protein
MNKRQFSILCAGSLITLLLAASSSPAVHAGTIDGRWRLVEQTYGSGGSNLMRSTSPVRLEFVRTASGFTGRVWAADDKSTGTPWPAVFSDGKAYGADLREIDVTASGDGVRAVYVVDLPDDPGVQLEITETYRVSSDDDSMMTGTVTIRMVRGGKQAGAYTLRRRFEREP